MTIPPSEETHVIRVKDVDSYLRKITVNGIPQTEDTNNIQTVYRFATLEEYEDAKDDIPENALVIKEYEEDEAPYFQLADYENIDETDLVPIVNTTILLTGFGNKVIEYKTVTAPDDGYLLIDASGVKSDKDVWAFMQISHEGIPIFSESGYDIGSLSLNTEIICEKNGEYQLICFYLTGEGDVEEIPIVARYVPPKLKVGTAAPSSVQQKYYIQTLDWDNYLSDIGTAAPSSPEDLSVDQDITKLQKISEATAPGPGVLEFRVCVGKNTTKVAYSEIYVKCDDKEVMIDGTHNGNGSPHYYRGIYPCNEGEVFSTNVRFHGFEETTQVSFTDLINEINFIPFKLVEVPAPTE
jgi:hypothetical protein